MSKFQHLEGSVKSPNTCVEYAAKSLQLCPILCDPIDGSPPDSPVPGILQARTLEWVAISFSNAWKWKVKVKSLSPVRLFATPMDCSLPGSSILGIFQARVLEWDAIVFSSVEYKSFNYHSSVIYRSSKDHVVCLILKQLRQDFCSPAFKDRSYI